MCDSSCLNNNKVDVSSTDKENYFSTLSISRYHEQFVFIVIKLALLFCYKEIPVHNLHGVCTIINAPDLVGETGVLVWSLHWIIHADCTVPWIQYLTQNSIINPWTCACMFRNICKHTQRTQCWQTQHGSRTQSIFERSSYTQHVWLYAQFNMHACYLTGKYLSKCEMLFILSFVYTQLGNAQ